MFEELTTLAEETEWTLKRPVAAQVADRGLYQLGDVDALERGPRVEICPTSKISNDHCPIPTNYSIKGKDQTSSNLNELREAL